MVAVGVLMLCGFSAASIFNVQFAYRVTYNGVTVGYVESAESLSEVEDAMSCCIKTKGADSFVGKPGLKLSLTVGSNIDSADIVAENILNNEDALKHVTVLTVDGETALAVNESIKTVEKKLSARLDSFATGEEDEISFVSDVKAECGFVTTDAIVSLDDAVEYIDNISVKTVATKSYVDEIPFEKEQTESDSYLKGYVKVTSKGVKGEADVTAKITCINGVETEREVLESTTLKEPVAQKEIVGTASVSKTSNTQYASSNSQFMWPLRKSVRQFITSYMGDGRGHKGIDIACNKGNDILAAMGGTVVYAHYRSDYGNFVVIDHGNSYRTVYAHASKLLVSKGQVVEKGDVIALVGSTGQSTGNHLHFEIRINDRAVNPLSYTSR
ncbi:MAG: peptidoglycan DD-metalloendopeptidase family protein [Clostridia bacterium]|nr:peptidoglycan DD-metalloendopeptidase family protein [Clostridia bacterium]